MYLYKASVFYAFLSIHSSIHPSSIHEPSNEVPPAKKKKKPVGPHPIISFLIPLSPSLYLACGTRDEESQKKKCTGISQQKKPLNTLCLHEILQNRMQSPFNTNVLNFPKCSGCHINNNSTQLKQAMY